MKNVVFLGVAPCRYCVNRRFGGTYRLRLQGIRYLQAMNQRKETADCRHLLSLVYRSRISYTLKMEAIFMLFPSGIDEVHRDKRTVSLFTMTTYLNKLVFSVSVTCPKLYQCENCKIGFNFITNSLSLKIG
jgi:hypothetical protein